ncbi:uncharacterized protein ColSpa_04832 [Colletotrichum spaethianum]|uniref:Uncharacterized protein n=1 Tax=Colletotrichum spaethianum TaxID=700344 RepID=A0AA37L9P5_9PEZI|nr:uncharacterized protein ColSpa_04832 [Colletotrichum spaethianum]GKT44651.1 hypothetical protein ColSpa_04832 [Colletotrichum spaethianum]
MSSPPTHEASATVRPAVAPSAAEEVPQVATESQPSAQDTQEEVIEAAPQENEVTNANMGIQQEENEGDDADSALGDE